MTTTLLDAAAHLVLMHKTAIQIAEEAKELSTEALARFASQCNGVAARTSDAAGSSILSQLTLKGKDGTDRPLRATISRGRELRATKTADGIMSILETNMRAYYEVSQQGWSYGDKKDELFDDDARFIIVRDQILGDAEDPIAAFLNWRFDFEECEEDDSCKRANEDDVEVAYCYEVQVSKAYQHAELGSRLMAMLEQIAAGARMRKVMLTVFLSNHAALGFYKKLDYRVDLISPSQFEAEEGSPEADYEIMSKVVR